ncbi:zinc ribbon domain-containing protein [uncultured Flavonifractor sp.]|uniref:zinc ribbon domain-containing protein n=1 Tax=uncultured Flavonifractor sp. TaxID=1193534 RepID=UPI002616C26F|nr:zinc ribbon domain-containing protein [uncultured Flavonifractor sp.]
MYCEHCGTQIPDGSIFCVVCGKRQSGSVAAQPAQQETVWKAPEDTAPEGKKESGVSDLWQPAGSSEPAPEEATVQVSESEAQAFFQQNVQSSQPSWQADYQQSQQQSSQPSWQAGYQQSQQQSSQPSWQASYQQSQQQSSQPSWQAGYQQSQQQSSQPSWQASYQQSQQQSSQPSWQAGYQQDNAQQNSYNSPYVEHKQPVYRNGRIDYGCSMNWYKYQIYFNLVPMSLIYMALGVTLLVVAMMEGVMVSAVEGYYYNFGSLLMSPERALGLLLPLFIPSPLLIGIVCAAFGVAVLVSWVKMIRLKSGGWVMYLIVTSLPAAFMVINLLIAISTLGRYIPAGYMMNVLGVPLGIIASNVVVIILQIVYFKKRSYLFIN